MMAERAILEGARSPTSPILMSRRKHDPGLPGDDDGWDSVEKHKGGLAAAEACQSTDWNGRYDFLVTNSWNRSVVFATEHGLRCEASRRLDQVGAKRVLMEFLTRGYWRLVQDPTSHSSKNRSEARQKRHRGRLCGARQRSQVERQRVWF